jgi:hypothetical protein
MSAPTDDLARDGVAFVRQALPRPLMDEASRRAADYFFVQRRDAGSGAILNVLPELVPLIGEGVPGQIAREWFGGEFLVPVQGLFVRRFAPQREPENELPYHQDCYVFPKHWDMLNCWVLLYPQNHEDCARLEVIREALDRPIELDLSPTHPTRRWMEIDHETVDSLGSKAWVPPVTLGDVVMFHQYTAHRTRHDGGNLPRVSLEFRMLKVTDEVLSTYAANGQTVLRSNGEIYPLRK